MLLIQALFTYQKKEKIAIAGASRGSLSEESSETSQTPPTIAPTILTSENAPLQITTKKLNGKFFLPWSSVVLMVVQGCGKLRYLNGTITEPAKTNPTYPTWDANNSIVISWLVNSMTEVQGNYLYYPTVKKDLRL